VPAHPGEKPTAFDVDAGEHECGRDVFGEVFEVIGHVRSGAGGQVEVVDLVDFTDRGRHDYRIDLH
jgi:hypothetical protein